MRIISILIILFSLTCAIQAQSVQESIAKKACNCLASVVTLSELEDSLQNCITNAMADQLSDGSFDENKALTTVEGIQGTYKSIREILLSICFNVRKLIVEEKKKKHYKISADSLAREHYLRGNDFMEAGDYKNSTKEFQMAVKLDPGFVYAIDHLAISYRRQDDFKKAIKYYKQSLDVFPEGDLALLNIAVAYSFLEDYDHSLDFYSKLIFLYQDDPEGYFGAGKVYFLKSDYEKALDNLFTAHRMYLNTNSEYSKDSEKLISLVYSAMKKQNKLDLFETKSKEYNIQMKE
ncbi:MAG: tetratricopeptide repeat protein [Bacteroidota bacterium]